MKTIKPQLKAEKNLYCILIFLTISFAFLFFFFFFHFQNKSLFIPLDYYSNRLTILWYQYNKYITLTADLLGLLFKSLLETFDFTNSKTYELSSKKKKKIVFIHCDVISKINTRLGRITTRGIKLDLKFQNMESIRILHQGIDPELSLLTVTSMSELYWVPLNWQWKAN